MIGGGGNDDSLRAVSSQLMGCSGELKMWSKNKFGG